MSALLRDARKRRTEPAAMRALLRDLAYVLLIPVAVTPSVRMAIVHLRTSVISPFRVEARAVIIVVAPVVALPVRGAADINAEARALKVNSLRQGSRGPGAGNRAEDGSGDH